MSGPLRRTKRSRPADAGEALPEGRAAESEGAENTAEMPPATPGADTRAEDVSAETPTEQTAPDTSAQPQDVSAETPTEQTAPDTSAHPQDVSAETPTEQTAPDAGAHAQDVSAETPAPPGGAPSAQDPAAATGEIVPAADPGAQTTETPATTEPKAKRRWLPFRRRAKTPSAPQQPAAVLVADPNVPAGVDPTEAPMRPPAGRRGRLRRRLRYLRRARELMLRDLGGLLYEIHRTGGGRVDAHATVVSAKVQRIAGLDAEAHALENALGAPRGETRVFEPGVGGTCAACGELYGSDARFCAHCGTAIGAPLEPVATPEPEPAKRAFWRRAAKPRHTSDDETGTTASTKADERPAAHDEATAHAAASPARADEKSDAEPAERDEGEPNAGAAAGDERNTGDEPTAGDATSAAPDAGDATTDEPTAADTTSAAPDAGDEQNAGERPSDERNLGDEREQAADPPVDADAPAEPPRADTTPGLPRTRRTDANPASADQAASHDSGTDSNGRPENRTNPGVSPGNPLFSRERS